MIDPPKLPWPLALVCWGIVLLGIVMPAVVWARWRKRRAAGFSITRGLQATPLGGREFLRLLAILILVQSMFILASVVIHGLGLLEEPARRVYHLIIYQSLFYLVCVGITHRFLRQAGRDWNQAFGLRASDFKNVLITASVTLVSVLIPLQLLTLTTQLIFSILGWPLEPQPIIQLMLDIHDPGLRIGLVLVAVLGAPVVEEVFFRGLLYPCLKQRLGFGHALWINAALFAAFHRHGASALPLFGLGIAFTLLYEWRGNLGASILMHAGFNSFSMALLFLTEAYRP